MLEQNDEWAVCRRYMTLETLAVVSDDQSVRRKAIVALMPSKQRSDRDRLLHHALGHYLGERQLECTPKVRHDK
jgi:hypothetical protein